MHACLGVETFYSSTGEKSVLRLCRNGLAPQHPSQPCTQRHVISSLSRSRGSLLRCIRIATAELAYEFSCTSLSSLKCYQLFVRVSRKPFALYSDRHRSPFANSAAPPSAHLSNMPRAAVSTALTSIPASSAILHNASNRLSSRNTCMR